MQFTWKKEYETGIEKIDSQHKSMFDLINNLYHECVIKENEEIVQETIIELKLYSIFHFSVEEKLFKKYEYNEADYEEHMKEHETFLNKVAELLADSSSSQYELGYRLIEFLKSWIVNHIFEIDMKFISFLKKNHFTEINLDEDITFNEEDFI